MSAHHERNAEMKRLHASGTTLTEIACRFGISSGRVRQIIFRDEFRANHRAALIAKYGKRPKIPSLPDDTPLEVLTLCDGQVQAWATRVMHLRFANPPIKTLGDLRRASDTQLLDVTNVGTKLVVELRRFCPVERADAKPKGHHDTRNARRALNMIRKAVEAHAPPGSVQRAIGDRDFVKEAEALIEGIFAIARSKSGGAG